MSESRSLAHKTAAQNHFHFGCQTCPYRDQPIPEDKVEEISGRIKARARERLAEETGRLREQFAREREEAEAKAAAREKAIREEAAAAAEVGAAEKIAAAEAAKAQAEEARSGLAAQLEAERADESSIVERMTREAATREEAIREEATKVAEVGGAEKIAAAETAKEEAERGRLAAEAVLAEKLAERGREIEVLKEAHAGEINAQREALEKDKIATVNAERAGSLKVRMKLEEDLADMQRRLQQKTSHEHGEGAELDLYEVLKAAFEGDRIRRVAKGSPGADLILEFIEDGKVVVDSKNRGKWKAEYAAKLRRDQIAEKADFAILSTNKFPRDRRELCTFENVILAGPARVLAPC
jgi:hypothetical protein